LGYPAKVIVDTLFRWVEDIAANIFRTTYIKLYQNIAGFCRRYDKTFWLFFFGSRCIWYM